MRQLVVHIGLPKTGTTTLQTAWFPQLPGLGQASGTDGPAATEAARELARELRLFLQNLANRPPSAGLEALLGEGDGLLTHELIALVPNVHGTYTGAEQPPPERIAANAARLRQIAGIQPKLLVTLRRQGPWLAARYAESAARWTHPDQGDFEAVVAKLHATPAPHSALVRWLDYGYLAELFYAVLGPERVLFLPMEALAAAPEASWAQLAEFARAAPAGPPPRSEMANSLAIGEGWQLRNHPGRISLTAELAERIAERFGPANRYFVEQTGIDLAAYGYSGVGA